jgi:outer membrane protein TolC
VRWTQLGVAACLFLQAAYAPRASADEAAPRELTEEAYVEAVLAAHPALRETRAGCAAAESERDAVLWSTVPEVALQARVTRLSSLPERFRTLTLPGAPAESAVTLPQVLDNFAVRATVVVPLTESILRWSLTAPAANLGVEACEQSEEALRDRAAYEARTTFLTYRRAWLALHLAESARDVAELQVRVAEVDLETGRSSQADLLLLRASALERREAVARASVELESGFVGLSVFFPGLSVAPTPIVRRLPEEALAPPKRALESAQVRAARSQVEAARLRETEASLALVPRVSLFAVGDVSAPSARAFGATDLTAVPTWELTAQLEWSRSSLTQGSTGRRRAEAEAAAATARLEQATLESSHATREAELRVRGGGDLRRVARERVELARRVVELREAERARGVATIPDVIAAREALFEAQLVELDVETELRIALAKRELEGGSR